MKEFLHSKFPIAIAFPIVPTHVQAALAFNVPPNLDVIADQ